MGEFVGVPFRNMGKWRNRDIKLGHVNTATLDVIAASGGVSRYHAMLKAALPLKSPLAPVNTGERMSHESNATCGCPRTAAATIRTRPQLQILFRTACT